MKNVIVLLLMVVSFQVAAADPILCDEISNDPLGRGYSGMDAVAIAADLNTAYRTEWKNCVPGADLLDAIEAGDWVSIPDAQQQQALSLLSIGCLDPQKNARTMMIGIFGAGSSTIVSMADIAQDSITRAQELNLPFVKPSHLTGCN